MDETPFAPAPFDPGQALGLLERQLRELGLSRRGAGYELQGRELVRLAVDGDAIEARRVRRPAITPQWEPPQRLRTHAATRAFVEDLKRQLSRWRDADD